MNKPLTEFTEIVRKTWGIPDCKRCIQEDCMINRSWALDDPDRPVVEGCSKYKERPTKLKTGGNPMINQTLRFYNALYQEFPTEKLLELMYAIATDQIECWRNAGVALAAILKHSRNSRGNYSQELWDRNRARLDELREEFAPDVIFQA